MQAPGTTKDSMNASKTHPDFTGLLCAASDLVDIAPQGLATQSSISKWSRPDDAQQAVLGSPRPDFGFHTDREDAPWWQLSFDVPQKPEAIVISNRRRIEFQGVARSLRVEISTDGAEWMTVHSGCTLFGADGAGIPLILPMDPQIRLRHLRLSLEEPGYLHLSTVRVLARGYAQTTGPVFVTQRSDGFGERLKGIVNTIAMAELFDGDFAFDWPGFSVHTAIHHAIGTPHEIFSDAFLARHQGVPGPAVKLAAFLRQDAAGKPDESTIVQTPHTPLEEVDPALGARLDSGAFAQAFWRIGFSDGLTRAVALADGMQLAESTVGLHLRAGDIVYGRYRFNRRYTNKVVPYPLCLAFLTEERAAGRDVLLFGQDAKLCRELAAATGARFAGDMHDIHGLDTHQAALFDIVAMARCARVVAGQSGFSRSPSASVASR